MSSGQRSGLSASSLRTRGTQRDSQKSVTVLCDQCGREVEQDQGYGSTSSVDSTVRAANRSSREVLDKTDEKKASSSDEEQKLCRRCRAQKNSNGTTEVPSSSRFGIYQRLNSAPNGVSELTSNRYGAKKGYDIEKTKSSGDVVGGYRRVRSGDSTPTGHHLTSSSSYNSGRQGYGDRPPAGPPRRPPMARGGLSHIHAFILSKLPQGDAKQTFLKQLIDYDTPEAERLAREKEEQMRLKGHTGSSHSGSESNLAEGPDVERSRSEFEMERRRRRSAVSRTASESTVSFRSFEGSLWSFSDFCSSYPHEKMVCLLKFFKLLHGWVVVCVFMTKLIFQGLFQELGFQEFKIFWGLVL